MRILITHNKIEIIGDIEFTAYIVKMLDFLETNAPRRFKTFKKYIGRIDEYSISVVAPMEYTPTCYLSKKTAFYSITWCAAYLVHESHHSKLYLDYLKKNKKIPPRSIYCGKKVELECIKQQISAAKQLKAPKAEIEYLQKQDGLHYTLKQDW